MLMKVKMMQKSLDAKSSHLALIKLTYIHLNLKFESITLGLNDSASTHIWLEAWQ